MEISLAEIGGKGLFTRELDVALASKEAGRGGGEVGRYKKFCPLKIGRLCMFMPQRKRESISTIFSGAMAVSFREGTCFEEGILSTDFSGSCKGWDR